MDVAELKAELSHSSFVTAAGTFAAYALVILAMTLVLFMIPYALFILF